MPPSGARDNRGHSRFTEEDEFHPIYCRRCRKHVPRTEADRYAGLCTKCATELYHTDTGVGQCLNCGSPNLTNRYSQVRCDYCGHSCSVFEHQLVSGFKQLEGTQLRNRYEWTERVRPILFEIEARKHIEAQVVILLSKTNQVEDSILNLGTWNHVQFSIDEIVRRARKVHAYKAIMAHNHPGWFDSTPSDQDVESAARVYFYLKSNGVEVVDDLVVCRSGGRPELKSVHNTLRFKHMIKNY